MIKKLLKFALTLGIAFFVSDLPPIVDPQDMTLHATAALEAKEVPEGAILNIEPKSAEVEVPEAIIPDEKPLKKMTTTCEPVHLSTGDVQCINYLINKKALNEDELKSHSDEVNVLLSGWGGGDASESAMFAYEQLNNEIYQSLIGPIWPGWTNEKFGKTSPNPWNYRAAKDMYAELLLKLKEKHGKIQVIGFSYGGLMAIVGYLSLKKEDREGIRVLVGDPGMIEFEKSIGGWLASLDLESYFIFTPRYDGSWYDFWTFPLTLPGRLIMWIYRQFDPFIEQRLHLYWYQKQMDELLAKEDDGSLDIQITACGKKVSDFSDQDIADYMEYNDNRYRYIEISKEEISEKRKKMMSKSREIDGGYTADSLRIRMEEMAKKTLYPAPLVVFDCLHSCQMMVSEFWEFLKKRMRELKERSKEQSESKENKQGQEELKEK